MRTKIRVRAGQARGPGVGGAVARTLLIHRGGDRRFSRILRSWISGTERKKPPAGRQGALRRAWTASGSMMPFGGGFGGKDEGQAPGRYWPYRALVKACAPARAEVWIMAVCSMGHAGFRLLPGRRSACVHPGGVTGRRRGLGFRQALGVTAANTQPSGVFRPLERREKWGFSCSFGRRFKRTFSPPL